jgi:hypothetical protein
LVAESEEDEELLTINDDYAIDILLKLLARFRDDFPKSGSHDPMLESFIPFFSKKKITTSLPELRSKRSTLRDSYKKALRSIADKRPLNSRKERLLNVGKVVFDKADKATLKGTPFEWTVEDEKLYAECMEGAGKGEGNFLQSLIKFSQCKFFGNVL